MAKGPTPSGQPTLVNFVVGTQTDTAVIDIGGNDLLGQTTGAAIVILP